MGQLVPDTAADRVLLLLLVHCVSLVSRNALNQFFGFKEAFQVPHLPDPGDDEDEGLSDGPPEDALVGALARHAEPLLPVLPGTNQRSELKA